MWLNLEAKDLEAVCSLLRGKAPMHFADQEALAGRIEAAVKNMTVGKVEQAYVEAAKEFEHKDGECEIDSDAVVSLSDDAGAYVMAWVWVDEDSMRRRRKSIRRKR